jgi:hypothetical protein
MILFLLIKHKVNNVIIRYIVYDDICLMVRKINYFFFIFLFFFILEDGAKDYIKNATIAPNPPILRKARNILEQNAIIF